MEETTKRRRVLARACPDDLAALVVDHGRDVLVMTAAADLVDADMGQPVKSNTMSLFVTTDDATNDVANSPP